MVQEKRGGNSMVFMPATIVPAQKKRFVREIKLKELRRRSLNSYMHKIKKEHARGQTLLNEIETRLLKVNPGLRVNPANP